MNPDELKAWLKEREEKDRGLYEKYGKQLEAEHKDEFLAISDKGEIILGSSRQEVMLQAFDRFGSGNYGFFRIGFTYSATWRRHR